jgi:hypothetical protein
MEDKCEMCGTVIHSITTRRVGDHQFCRDCGDDIVLPYINAISNVQIDMLLTFFKKEGKQKTQEFSNRAVMEMLTT